MNLSNIFKKHLKARDSGLLSIKIEGENHLLKIYLEKGEVVAISCGTYKNEDCLKKLNAIVPLEHFFLEGVKPPITSSIPLTDKLLEIIGAIDFKINIETPSNTGTNIQPETITALEEEFIDLIGPIGKVLIDNIFSEISYSRGEPMPLEYYSYLLESLIKELPSHLQTSFSEKYKR